MLIKHIRRAAAVAGIALCATLAFGGFAQASAESAPSTSVSQEATNRLHLKGTVSSLSTGNNGVTVFELAAGEHTVKWGVTDKTEVTENGSPASAGDIEVGDQVTVEGGVPSSELPPENAIIAASKVAIH